MILNSFAILMDENSTFVEIANKGAMLIVI